MDEQQKAVVVVVDDELVLVDVVCELLADAGIPAQGCPGGQEAVPYILSEQPRLIILDLQMPQVDGVTIFQQLRSAQETRDIPVVFFTADEASLSKRVPDFREQHAQLLVKPFTEGDLLAAVERSLAP